MTHKIKLLLVSVILMLIHSSAVLAKDIVVKGTVIDETGLPLIGAGVLSQDGKRGTVTDLDGKYSITLTEDDKIIKFSFIGYVTTEIVVDGRTEINVTMQPDKSTTLNDVVVIGYGTSKKSDLTGSVASVKMDDIVDTPTLSVDQALQGKVAGMDVMSISGEPGAGTSIRIRGTRSIEASNEPLIVVDGVMDAVVDMNEINPDDIENIAILKDASSTAIYGSRGANGVVLITTKKGVTSKPTVTAKASFGVSNLARNLDLMNTAELIAYRNDCAYIDSYVQAPTSIPTTPKYDPASYDNNTNWISEITRTGFTSSANVSVSGKTNASKYFASGAFYGTQGVVDGSGAMRGTARLNITHDFTKWLSIGLKATYTYMKENPNKATIGGTNIYTGAVYLAPFIGAYDTVNPLYLNGSNINTPRVTIDQVDYYKIRQNSSFSGIITIKPVTGLTIESQNSYTPQHVHVYKYSPSTLPARYEGQGGLANRTEYNANQLMTENTVTYNKKFKGDHALAAMAGFSASKKIVENVSIAADGIIDDNLKWNNLNAISTKEGYTNTSYKTTVVRESAYARLNYNFKGRYYATVTMRADGSSNFAENRKWGFFPSGALKWNLKNEKFLLPVRWLDNLSIRLSAGVTGNDAISPYQSLGIYSSSTSGAVFEGTQSAAFYPSRVANPDLSWEKTTMYNVGLDFSIFKERLSLTVDAYYSRTQDLLLELKTIQSTGFSSRWTNLGITSNKGLEVTLSSHNIVRRNFGWSTDLTISTNRQMVEDVGNENLISVMESKGYTMYGYKAGYPLNALWGFKYEGVFHNVEEVQENLQTKEYASQTTLSGENPNYYNLLGRPKYKDVNHDGNLSKDDLQYLGSADPDIYGGFNNTFNIYKFKVGVYLTYSLGGYIYNFSELAMSGSYYTNQYRYMTDSWHPVRNPNSDIPRAGIGDIHVPSSLQVHDASYLRLKSASVSYTFDFEKKKNHGNWSMTLGLTGENLFLLTGYNGFDPDVSTSSETSTLRRADIGAYPKSRTIVFNLQIKL